MSTPLARDPTRYAETRIDDEIVVMSLETGDFFSLTGSAAAIWAILDGTLDRAGLLAELARRYETSEAELAPDVDAFVGELRSAGLLRET